MEKKEETFPFLYEFSDLYALYIQPLNVFNVCLQQFSLKQRFPRFMATCAISGPPSIFYTGGKSESKSYKLTVQITLNLAESTIVEESKEKMNHAHFCHAMATINNDQILAISGFDHEELASKRCEKYILSHQKWYDMSSVPTPRGFAAVCTLENQVVYLFGGATDPSEITMIDAIDCYRVVPDRWETIKLLLNQGWRARTGAAACPIDDDTILVFGGTEKKDQDSTLSLEFIPNSTAIRKTSVLHSASSFYGENSLCVKKYKNFVYAVHDHICHIYNIDTHIWKKVKLELK